MGSNQIDDLARQPPRGSFLLSAVHLLPSSTVPVAPCKLALVVDGDEREPAIVKQRTDVRMPLQDVGDGFFRGFDGDSQPQRFMDQFFNIMHRLPG